MKQKCLWCGREYTVDTDVESENPFALLTGLGPTCQKKLLSGDPKTQILLFNTKELAGKIWDQQYDVAMSAVNTKNMSEEEKHAASIAAATLAWYQSFMNFSSPATRLGHLEMIRDTVNASIDIGYGGLPSLKALNEKYFLQYSKEAHEKLFDAGNSDAYRQIISQITGFDLPKEKEIDDYLWDEFRVENLFGYPYAVAGVSPSSPIEMFLVDQYFLSLKRSFMEGYVGPTKDFVKQTAEFVPFAKEGDAAYQANVLVDFGLGGRKQAAYVETFEKILMSSAFLKTGKNDTFVANVKEVLEGADIGDEDRDVIENAVQSYLNRVKSEKFIFLNPKTNQEILRPRTSNEYASIMNSLKDFVRNPGTISAADPAVIAMAPVAREIEEKGQGSGLILSVGDAGVRMQVANPAIKKVADPFQRAYTIFKSLSKTGSTSELESLVADDSHVVLTSATFKDGDKTFSRTVAYVFEKGIISEDMIAIRNISEEAMHEEGGKKLGLVVTESWEMPHDRSQYLFSANLRPVYDRAIKTSTPQEEHDLKFFTARHGRLEHTMSAQNLELTGSWLRALPAPTLPERGILMQKMDQNHNLITVLGKKFKETVEAITKSQSEDRE